MALNARLIWALPALVLLTAAPARSAPAAVAAAPADAGTLARQVKQVFQANCYRCHGEKGAEEGGIAYVTDLGRLVERKKVVPRDPANSKIFKKLVSSDDPMPPAVDNDNKPITQRPSAAEVALVKQWIEAGAPTDAQPVARAFVAEADTLNAIFKDLGTVEERDRPFARYFTITHLYNAGLNDDELQTYRGGLSKLLNSLSWGRRIVPPKAVDAGRTLFRIDLRDYRWNEKTWRLLLADYPYGVQLTTPIARGVYKATACDLPYLRADWLVFAASRPPLYHDILALPATDAELEKLLQLDAAENIRTERVARAGFNGSGVSQNNRLIERHESTYGAYWKSYDFRAARSDRKNLFAHPLGPGAAADLFDQDGGELIFSLPNGLQGYLLVDGKGGRIDKGPVDVVSDPKQKDRAVVNGVSCMSCHANGMIEKQDQVRDAVLKNPAGFTSKTIDAVKGLYPPHAAFDRLLAEDKQRFVKAVEATGAARTGSEPVFTLANRFEADLDLKLAAAEAGLPPADFARRIGQSRVLAGRLGVLNVPGGTVSRAVYVGTFGEIVREFALGTLVQPVPRDPLATMPPIAPTALAPAPAAGLPGATVVGNGTGAAPARPPVRLEAPTHLAKFIPAQLVASDTFAAAKDGGIIPKNGTAIRTKAADFLAKNKDFVFDVWVKIEKAGEPAFVGIGDGNIENSLGILLRPTDDQHHGAHLVRGDQWGDDIVDVREPGEYVIRVERHAGTMTFSIGGEKAGQFEADGSKTVTEPKEFMKRLDERSAHLFFGGGVQYKQFRLLVGPAAAAAVAATGQQPAATATVAAAQNGGIVPLGQVLPPLLSASESYAAAKGGGVIPRKGTFISTKAADFLSKDFVFDVWVTVEKGGEAAFVGVGEGKLENSLGVLLRSPDNPDHGARLVRGDQWGEVMVDVREFGEHMIRVERHGDAMTFSVGVEKPGGAFEPDGSKTVMDPKEFMKALNERSARLFLGNAALYRQYRLTVGPAAAAAGGAAAPAGPPANGAVVPLGQVLPPALTAAESYAAPPGGGIIPRAGTFVATRAADFLGQDFVFDVWQKVERTGEWSYIGIGDGHLENSLAISIRPPGEREHDVRLTKGDQWGEVVGAVREPGVYVVRVERHAGTMTFSVGTERDGRFEPDMSQTVADPKAFMPRLSERSAHLYFGGGVLFLQYRLTVGPEAAAMTPAAVAKPAKPAAAPADKPKKRK